MRNTNVLNGVGIVKRLAIKNIASLVLKNNVTVNSKTVTDRNLINKKVRSIRNIFILLRNKKLKQLFKLQNDLMSNNVKFLNI